MKFLGVTILQGVEFSIFPIDFEWALQQCSATALPVIGSRMSFRLVPTSETLNDLERRNGPYFALLLRNFIVSGRIA